MTLFKQLALTMTLFLTLILATVMGLNFKTATEFVQNQLATDAKNTAYSLGLSLSKVADPTDPSTMETMINAIFDSGYYESIVLTDLDGKTIVRRINPVVITDVPTWFVRAIPIESRPASSTVMSGWSRYGTLTVIGHAGHAYRQLYGSLLDIVKTFVLFTAGILAMLYVMLSLSLKSLATIKRQAEAIIANDFVFSEKLPFTTDLRAVTVAMNSMVAKVKDIFTRESETLRRYQELLYRDPVTGLANRRYLTSKLPDYLHEESPLGEGIFVLLGIEEGDKAKKTLGYERFNTLVIKIAESLTLLARSIPDGLVVRLSDYDFLAVLPGAAPETLQTQIGLILGQLKHHPVQKEGLEAVICAGIGHYIPIDTLKSLLSRADMALLQAFGNGGFTAHVIEQSHTQSLAIPGKEAWRDEIIASLADNRMLLALQPVILREGDHRTVYHHEVFLRMRDRAGSLHPAGYFIPMAVQFGMGDEIDRFAISRAMDYMLALAPEHGYCLNLGSAFMTSPAHMEWLAIKLANFTKNSDVKIAFEVNNFIAQRFDESVHAFAAMIRRYGHRFGIDHFTVPEEGVGYLQTIRPDYLKINATYLEEMIHNKATGGANESLPIIAESLGITLIAVNIEDALTMETLYGLGINHFQGSYIAPALLFK